MELVGRRFGHIRVVDLLGQGGMGDVYAGFDEKLQRNVALKVLHSERRLDAEARERLLREARALSKLDHTNICRVYDYLEGGDVDLLVLEYIEGETLQDAMARKTSRAEKLRIAAAIAEVLVAAHRFGIIHRDLKPENVMLTVSGEVKVLDFGLARWLTMISSIHMAPAKVTAKLHANGELDDWYVLDDLGATAVVPVDEAVSPRRNAYLATAAGVTMGTPMYMSPEQARGQTLTPATDMFSFGLMLQWMFTGHEPHPEELTAREVMIRTSRGTTSPMTGDRDVVALVNQLKQVAPSDRPTAVDALAIIRRIIDKPKRVARRAAIVATALLVAGGAWRYTVDLRRERTEAQIARDEAQIAHAEAARRRAQAEQLIDFTVGDLRKKLEPLGRLDILEEAAQRSLAYFSSLDPQSLSVDELVRNAKALDQLGEVRIAQGKLDDAMSAFQQSVVLSTAATKRDDLNPAARLSLGTSYFWTAHAYQLRGELPKALEQMNRYLAAGEWLAKNYPKSDEYALERAYGHSAVAQIMENLGDVRGALVHLRTTRAIKEARLAASPADAERQADLAMTLNRIGFDLQRLGDLPGARKHFELEFATYDRLVAADPQHSAWKERLVTSHSYLGSLLEMMGELDRSLEHRRAEIALDEALCAHDPSNTRWQRNLAVAYVLLGNVLRLKGDPQAAAAQLARGERTLTPLLAGAAVPWYFRRDLGVLRVFQARVALARHDAGAARRYASDAVEQLDPLTNQEAAIRWIGEAHLVAGEAFAASGDRAAADREWAKGENVLAPVARVTDAPDVLDVWTRTLVRRGRFAEAKGAAQRLTNGGYRGPDFLIAMKEERL